MAGNPNFSPINFDLAAGTELTVSHFQPGTSQPRQSVEIHCEGFVVNISRPANNSLAESSSSVADIPSLLSRYQAYRTCYASSDRFH
jgi:hypothetical protein